MGDAAAVSETATTSENGDTARHAEPEPEPTTSKVAVGVPKRARWVVAITALIALIAIGLATWSLLRSQGASGAAPFSDEQVTGAKARACTAYATVRSAVSLQTHADLGTDPVAVQATAANARLALAAGGSYLGERLDPATPHELAVAIRSFADNLQDIAMNTLAGVGNDDPAQAARLHDGEAVSTQIGELCK